MAITKTNFINYTRCRRYGALESIHKDKLDSNMTLEEYLKEEENEKYKEMLGTMFESNDEGEDIDKTVKIDIQLEAMMEYYKEVEVTAGLYVEKIFGGETIYSLDTYRQESFDFSKNGIKYLCFVDIYNESNNEINIIEVKATTSRKYKKMEYSIEKEKFPLFTKIGNFYHLAKDPGLSKNYSKKVENLLDRFSDVGKYMYDLSVQRFIIEGYLRENNISKNVNYFLAVLNDEYEYDGYTENGKRVFRPDRFGNEIIDLYELNDITSMYGPKINIERQNLEKYIFESDESPCKLGVQCALKKNTECKYKPICFKNVPEKNASFNYKRFVSFKDNGIKYNKYDLINEGYLKLSDVPESWLTSENHKIQRACYDNNEVYINKAKIKAGLDSLSYPIYHLDFETLPCPIPRFKGEHPYYQSPFEFSLHIEREPGVCDKELDNYVFLARTNADERLDLVRELVDRIPIKNGGCMLAQNVTFEKGRLKELAAIFPEYKEELLAIRESGRDLLEIIDNNKELYESLGFNEYDSSTMNYYNSAQSGSFSIKKTLPLFTNLSYKDLEVQNGTQALVEYANYKNMTEEERQRKQAALVEYCKQDTWAMVEILRGLRDAIK